MLSIYNKVQVKLLKKWKIDKSFTSRLALMRENSTMLGSQNMMEIFKSCIPPLDGKKHKGEAGRIGVVGGSLEYTGAPYFAAISALKVGGDLVHIFCQSTAATVIKSYSPELIVHPLLDCDEAIQQIKPWLERLHVIVIGPGLGRNEDIFKKTLDLIKIIKELNKPLVIDADGLALLTENLDILRDFTTPVVITPNAIEYQRLFDKIAANGLDKTTALGKNVTVLKKGPSDEFVSSDQEIQWKLAEGGSGRRCGGQGDILSGSLATFFFWTFTNLHTSCVCVNNELEPKDLLKAAAVASYAASHLVRLCNEKAFSVKGRSMTASDMIEFIHPSFVALFEK